MWLRHFHSDCLLAILQTELLHATNMHSRRAVLTFETEINMVSYPVSCSYMDACFRLTAETLAHSPCLLPEEDECYVLGGIRSRPHSKGVC